MDESQEMQDQPMKQDEQIQNGVTQNGAAAQNAGAEESVETAQARRITELEAQLAQAKQEAGENWTKYLRERAEMENFRKRQERLAADRVAYEKKTLLHKILDVMDNVERGLVYQETMDKQALQHTLRMLLWQLNEVLRGEGINPLVSLGETFDPRLHDAIEAVESEQPEGIIVEEVRKGYKMGDETMRPARVKVSSGNKNIQEQNGQSE